MKIVTMFLVLCLCFSICVSANDLKNEIYTYELEEFICIKEINDKSLTGKNNCTGIYRQCSCKKNKFAYIFKFKCGRNRI